MEFSAKKKATQKKKNNGDAKSSLIGLKSHSHSKRKEPALGI